MDRKKTVWIVLASGIFLAVVLGVALILYSAESRKNTTAQEQRDAGNVWMSPEVAEAKDAAAVAERSLPPLPAPGGENGNSANSAAPVPNVEVPNVKGGNVSQSENVTVISTGSTSVYNVGKTTSTTIDLDSLKESAVSKSSVAPQNGAAETAMKETGKIYKNAESEVITQSPSAAKTAASGSTPSQKKPSAAASPAPAKTAAAAPEKAGGTRFWVQAGSYTSTKNADAARGVLETNKMPCEVFTFSDGEGVLRYRVRVGPYISKSEAEYWKHQIDTIPIFSAGGSYVVSSTL